MHKSYWYAKTDDFPKGDKRFTRDEYQGSGFALVCYSGDSSIGQAIPHGHCKEKNRRPHIRNAPLVKPKVIAKAATGSAPKVVHDELTSKYLYYYSGISPKFTSHPVVHEIIVNFT